MSEIVDHADGQPRRRADAERSIAAILDGAVAVLAEKPDASMAEIAAAAGVTRQTVYAHFSGREPLLEAVAHRALAQALAAIDDAGSHQGPPVEALDRLIAAWWETVSRHARVLEALGSATLPTHAAVHAFHAPLLERLVRLARRGQRAGVFDRRVRATWLAAAFLGLMHTAAEEVAAGRLAPAAAGESLAHTVRAAFGVADR